MTHPTKLETALLRGVLCRVGTPSEPDPITGYPRILITTDEESIMAVERLPLLQPVVVIEESTHQQLRGEVEELKRKRDRYEIKAAILDDIKQIIFEDYPEGLELGLSEIRQAESLVKENQRLAARRHPLQPNPFRLIP